MTGGEWIAAALDLPASGVRTLLVLVAFLVAPTAYRLFAHLRRPGAETRQRLRRIGTWWMLFGLLLLVLALGRGAVVSVMLAISLLGLRESLRLVGVSELYPWLVAATIALYSWLWVAALTPFLRWLPLLVLLLAALELVGRRAGDGPFGMRPRPGLPLALLSTVVGPSYAVGVAELPAPHAMPETGLGGLVLLLMLTGIHDSAQAWWGRKFGSRRLAPRLSPNKTWEGLWGGLATTAAVAGLLGPTLTPIGRSQLPGLPAELPAWLPAVGLGLAVGLAGTAGDLAASALKRPAGADDSGDLVPGHGGVLDRFDSLAATAPVFFFLSYFLWYGG